MQPLDSGKRSDRNVLAYGDPAALPFQAADNETLRATGLAPIVAALPESVFAFLAAFDPKSIPESKRQRVAVFVRDAAAAVAPQNEFTASQTTAPIVRLINWAHVTSGLPLRYIVILAPATVEQFLAHSIAHQDLAPGTARNYRAHLARVACALGVAVSGSPTPIARTQRAHPYTAHDLDAWKLWTRTRASAVSIQRADVMLALMAGAGLRRTELLELRARHLIVDGDDTWVRVIGAHERIVPVLSQWQARLRRSTKYLVDDDLVFPQPTPMSAKVMQNWLGAMSLAPEPQRLRATWLVAHLAANTSPEHLLAWSGIERGETLAGYLAFLSEPASELQRRALLHASASGTKSVLVSPLWQLPRIDVPEGATSERGRTAS